MLKPAPVVIAPSPVPTPVPAPVTPPVTPVAEAPVHSSGGVDKGLATTGWGLAVGGAILTAGGTFLILLDGDVTCSDGRGRRECPTVYNTKPHGITALGLGGAMFGAGVSLLLVTYLGEDAQPALTPTVEPTADGAALGLHGTF